MLYVDLHIKSVNEFKKQSDDYINIEESAHLHYSKYTEMNSLLQSELSIKDCFKIFMYYEYWKKVNTYAILCHLVKSLNYVVYEHILVKRVTKKVKRMLIAINVNKVFT